MAELFEAYRGTKTFVTGHTGFKGSWLTHWMQRLGAEVTGFALAPNTTPSHFQTIRTDVESVIGNILDLAHLADSIRKAQPEIVFHMAAQPLVIDSYKDPVNTYQTNVIGTLNLLEACRQCESVRAIVVITTDKVYEIKEWLWPYRENDTLGGFDPYSSSKACAEILVKSYRSSYLHPDTYGSQHQMLLASARAGNVVGGGDWAEYRLIPDLVKAAAAGEKSDHPQSARHPALAARTRSAVGLLAARPAAAQWRIRICRGVQFRSQSRLGPECDPGAGGFQTVLGQNGLRSECRRRKTLS